MVDPDRRVGLLTHPSMKESASTKNNRTNDVGHVSPKDESTRSRTPGSGPGFGISREPTIIRSTVRGFTESKVQTFYVL